MEMGIDTHCRCQCKQLEQLMKINTHCHQQKLVKQKADELLDTSTSFHMQNSAEIDDICIVVSSVSICGPINFLLHLLRSKKNFQLSENTKTIGQYKTCSNCISNILPKHLRRVKEVGGEIVTNPEKDDSSCILFHHQIVKKNQK